MVLVIGLLALTQEMQLLRFSQVSGAGVVAGTRVVNSVESVWLVGAEVVYGAKVVF